MGELIPFDAGRPPAVLQGRQSSLNAAAKAGVQASFAVIGYKGRNWRLKYRGEETLLKDHQGTPFPHLDVVIVGVASAIAKQWYDKKFTEGSDDPPDCYSTNGVSPDPSSPKKQCTSCAACPMNVWGSRMTDGGKKAKACQDSRRIAVVPVGDIENESYGGPMLLRIPPMSLNNLASYADMLERKGAGLEYVATRLGFDYDVAYPLITFQAMGWLDNEQAQEVVGPDGKSGVCADPQIERMLSEAVTAAEPAEEKATDPLAGAPAQVFAHPHQAIAAPTTPAAPPVQAAPAAMSTETAAPKPAPRKKASPFQTAAAPEVIAAPAAAVAPTSNGSTATAPVVVQEMPEDMNAAIDNLLNMEVAG